MARYDAGSAIDRIHQITAKKGKPGLDRMRVILELLGSPEKDFKVIHVGGTNGKGSVCEFVSSVLKRAGYTVAVYTSPHVMKYNERFEACGRYITDDEFVEYAERVFDILPQIQEETGELPSEFEILTAIAYQFFHDMKPDFVILEVGLGGRLDSTNTIEKPLVTAITEVGIDHVAELGNTLEKIAGEKAGIIKPGVPMVCGVTDKGAREVIRKRAEELHAPFIDVTGDDSEDDVPIPRLAMRGRHQIRNAKVARAIIGELNRTMAAVVTRFQLTDGLADARKIGRYEILNEDPVLAIDGAHNPSGIAAAIETFDQDSIELSDDASLTVVMGFMADKEYEDMLRMIAEYFGHYNTTFIAAEPDSPRALKAEKIREILRGYGLGCIAVSSDLEAFEKARILGADYTLCLGSIYLIGKFRVLFQREEWKQNV